MSNVYDLKYSTTCSLKTKHYRKIFLITAIRTMETPISTVKRNNDPWVPLPEIETSAIIGDAPQNPLYTMIDSERYIQSLGKYISILLYWLNCLF